MNFTKEERYILHLCADQKFIDHVIDVFESVYPGKNIYFIELQENEPSLKLIESKNKNIVAGTSDSLQFRELFGRITDFAAVILHNIANPYKLDVIKKAPGSVYFHWMSWGVDLYVLPVLYKNIVLPQTRRYIRSQDSLKAIITKLLRDNISPLFNILYYLKYGRVSPLVEIKRCHKKIRSISTVIPSEYEYVRRFISPQMKYYPFKYITIERFDEGLEFVVCKEDNLLLGNSATAENNHLDAFTLLKATNIGDKRIYCPLSYGDANYVNYRDHIISEGKSGFGDRFIPLVDFLSLEDYCRILDLCGNVVMNHIRQQAMGNVVISLWKGARLFLNEANPVYDFLVENGIRVFRMSELGEIDKLPDHVTLANCNRPILKKLYCREQVLGETRNLVNVLINL